MISIFSDHK